MRDPEFWMFITGVATVVASIVLIASTFDRWQCSIHGKVTGYETQYRFPAGCYLKVRGQWMKYDEYVARTTASEGLKNE